MVPHRTVEEEEDRWGTEMVAGGHWEDNSEEDKVVVPQHGAPEEVEVEMDSWMDVMVAVVEEHEVVAAVEEHEVAAEGIGDVGSVDIADVGSGLQRGEYVAIKEVGIAD